MADCYVGEIRIFAGNYAPADWHICDGSLLAISSYQVLYTLLGTAFGGDGVNTFGIPNLLGRLPIGQGTGTGLTARAIGQTGGAETVQLTGGQNGAHNHSFSVMNVPPTTDTLTAGLVYAQAPTGAVFYVPAGTAGATAAALDQGAVVSAGVGAPHDNMMPGMALTYIISLVGIFPQRA
jgi:microcystin-dependent protein